MISILKRSRLLLSKDHLEAIGENTYQSSGLSPLSVVLGFAAVSIIGLAYTLLGPKDSEEDPGGVDPVEDVKSIADGKGFPNKVELPKLEDPKAIELTPPESLWSRIKKFFDLSDTPASPPPSSLGDKAKGSGENTPSGVQYPTKSVKPLPPNYRAVYIFPEGLKGADKLSKDGRYTEYEANRVAELKSSGQNTSASYTLAPSTKDLIMSRAAAYGLDPVRMVQIAKTESGGNPNAVSSTGAIGIFQLTGSTASSLGVQNRFDEAANIEAGMQLAVSNKKLANRMDIPETPLTLYLMHQLGPVATKEVLESANDPNKKIKSLTKKTQSKIQNNAGGKKAVTVKEYVTATESKLNSFVVDTSLSKANSVSSGERAPAVTTTPSLLPRPVDSLSTVPPEPSPVFKPSVATVMNSPAADQEYTQHWQPGGYAGPQTSKPTRQASTVFRGPGGVLIG